MQLFLLPLAAAAALGLGALLFAWSGVYSVAASKGHWAVFKWFLEFGMRNSVETHAMTVSSAPPLDDVNLIRLGAGHFHRGCAFCHGAPTMPVNPIARHMLPPPPELSEAAAHWSPEELFWIVKHGIKYTGMPAWATQRRDDEVWAVVAFLRRLPQLDEQGYRRLALDEVEIADKSGRELAVAESSPEATGACARCHGAGSVAPASNLVPVLHGQPAEYLLASLEAFAKGRRSSGIMQPIASDLDSAEMRELATYYSELSHPKPRSEQVQADAETLERGRRLAEEGLPSEAVPACNTCHGADALERFPRLAGQQAPYMIRKLELFKRGVDAATEGGAIMAPIASRLTETQIRDVSAYFAGLRPARTGTAGPP